MKKQSLTLVLGLCLVFLAAQAAADIEVTPMSYDFGIVEVGDSNAAIFTITNVPDGYQVPIHIRGIYLQPGSNPDFEITVNPGNYFILEVGESAEVEITFTPTTDDYAEAALMIISDGYPPSIYVPLTAGPVQVRCAETPICTEPNSQRIPEISGDRIVWNDNRNGQFNSDVYMYDLATGIETQITTDTKHQTGPVISGDRITWLDSRDGVPDIYMYDLATATEIPICTNSAWKWHPAISGDRIVWRDNRNGVHNYDVFMYDVYTCTETAICTAPGHQAYPAISGDRIIWNDGRNGNLDIYMYDLSTSTEIPICTDTNEQRYPEISGDRIVWHDNRNESYDIYMYDLSTGTEIPICTAPGTQVYPAISGDRIVWQDYRNDGSDIYMYDLATGTETRMSTGPAVQTHAAISGDRVVWEEYGGNYDIYMYTLYLPDIDVSPAAYDFGDVNVGESSTAIVTISNVGDANLTVSDIDFGTSSSSDFAITSAPSLPVVVEPDGFADVGLAFGPSALGYVEATLEIVSDDQCDPLLEIPLGGVGVSEEPPPDEQIAEILDFFDAAVEAETLSGDGPGNSAENRLNALRNMLEAAGDLIEDGEIEMACEQLQAALRKTDGQSHPPDFVTGDAASELAAMIVALRATLECE